MNSNAEGPTVTLAQAFATWCEAPHPKQPNVTNGERQPSDLKNFERALQCVAAAAGDGETDLDKLPLELLRMGDELVRRRVEEGAMLLARREKRKVPSQKIISNLTSCVRAVQIVVFAGQQKRLSIRELVAKQVDSPMAGRQGKRRFYFKDLPAAFQQDWEGYREWKMEDALPPREERFRKTQCNARSLETHRRRIGTYAGWLHQERDLANLRLEDLCDPDNYVAFFNWYLKRGTGGGYHTAKDCGTTLATISQYLVAKGRLEEFVDGKPIRTVLYAQSNKPLDIGAKRGELPEKRDVDAFSMADLTYIAQQGWDSEPVHRHTRHGQRHEAQLISRKRSGLWYRLAAETPLRLRNWREMRWNKNLFRRPDGRWQLRFRGPELKVAQRKHEMNIYEHAFTEEACAWIERWRLELQTRLGKDFEKTCPYVFPPAKLAAKPCHEDTLRTGIRGLALEILGRDFNPHLIRHVVATHVVRNSGNGLEGLHTAARLLGNTKATVYKTYAADSSEEGMRNYLEQLLATLK